MNIFTKICTAAALSLAASAAQADIGEHAFRMSLSIGGENAQTKSAQFFADEVSRLSDGKMTMEIFSGSQLGPDLQVLSGLRAGIIDAQALTPSLLGSINTNYNVFDIPYLFRNFEEVQAVIDGPAYDYLDKLGQENGFVTLNLATGLWKNVTNSVRPIATAADFDGLKIRTLQNEVFIDFFSALGANPVAIPFPELHSSLEQGTVDGQENVDGVTVFAGVMDVQKYFTETRHLPYVNILIFSKPVFDRLNTDEQAVILEAGRTSAAFWGDAYRGEAGFLSGKINEGLEVSVMPEDEFAKIYELSQPVIDKHMAAFDAEFIEQVNVSISTQR